MGVRAERGRVMVSYNAVIMFSWNDEMEILNSLVELQQRHDLLPLLETSHSYSSLFLFCATMARRLPRREVRAGQGIIRTLISPKDLLVLRC